MTAVKRDGDRHVIPRWRAFGETVRTGQLRSLSESIDNVPMPVDLMNSIHEFKQAPGLYTAGDLLGRAIVAGVDHPTVRDAAEYVRSLKYAPPPARELANLVLRDDGTVSAISISDPEAFDHRRASIRVATMRAIVRREPRNAIRWADLALAHISLGAHEDAEREMRVAVTLAPANRHILRCAAKLYVVRDNAKRSHELLVADPAVLRDPWLQAAELATAELTGRTSKYIRRARQVVDDRQFEPWHISELASELATAELNAGNVKKARRYMRAALQDPTENSLAQAEWASEQGVEKPHEDALTGPRSFEARARSHVQQDRFLDAAAEGLHWLADQPFDQEPALFTSYWASVGAEDYQLAIKAARQGLVAHPNNPMLLNNLVFALALSGDVPGADSELKKLNSVSTEADDHPTLAATRGLVAFRQGHIEQGRSYYQKALERLQASSDNQLTSLAALFWAREELTAQTMELPRALSLVDQLTRNTSTGEVGYWRARLQQLIQQDS